MSLPASFLDDLRARTPMAALVGRTVRLARSGRNWKGCCPFHGEKTPSFYVYDDHFHCYGCGAHGDAIAYVMQSTGAGFREAVEALAAEAGLSVPVASPQAAAAHQVRRDLYQVMDAAVAAFRRRLFLPEGAAALAYLEHRGLTRDTIATWGLGWSGPGRGAIAGDLARDGIRVDQLLQVGLMQAGDDGRPVDLFFNRVMFPIRDARGQVVSFGGRVLGNGQPKYVNGPETDIFSKRRTLYGLDVARARLRGGAPPVVVEGYTDVLALAQAGIPAAVAPLGTALTEDQLGLLWRLSPAPVLAFDGDAAGRRAAARVMDMALPMVSVDRGLSFLRLPAGDDPDSLVRRIGADDMRAMIARAEPLSVAGFGLLRQAGGEPTAELRAALRARVVAAAGRIQDPPLAAEMRRAWLARFLASTGDDGADASVVPGPADALFRHCVDTFPLAVQRAHARLSEVGILPAGLAPEPLIAAAPVQVEDGRIGLIGDRRPRARDWAMMVAVRDDPPHPDYSEAAIGDTAQRAVCAGRVLDVVACDPDLMRVIGRVDGTTAVLGWPQHPELVSAPVPVAETVNAWVRGGCRGVVLIGDDEQVQDWLLRCPRGVVAGAVPFARALETKLKRAGRKFPEIFVRQAA